MDKMRARTEVQSFIRPLPWMYSECSNLLYTDTASEKKSLDHFSLFDASSSHASTDGSKILIGGVKGKGGIEESISSGLLCRGW